MNMAVQTMLASSFGAAVQEIIFWYNLRHNLDEEKYASLVRSQGYWLALVVMIAGTGLAAFFWFDGPDWPKKKEALTFGIGLPLLVKQLGNAATSGVKYGARTTLLRYFRGS